VAGNVDKLIRKLEREGKIRKQTAGLVQIEALLRESMKDLDEAKSIAHIATRATYLLAYNAMLKAGRALLLFKGYRVHPGRWGTAQDRCGDDKRDIRRKLPISLRPFESMRRKRNELTYEAGILISGTDS
jgi:hypothetical protein